MAEFLSTQDVAEIAHLARLRLSDPEIESLRGELSSILQHMDALRSLDTTGVEPMTHAVPMALRLRPDVVAASLPVEVALEQAPAHAGEHFSVPSILESDPGDPS